MNASYSIPETAKLTGIPEHAIREYAKQFADVLPSPESPAEGGRATIKRYPDSALAIFRSIRKLKDEGLDTAQIRSALQTPLPYGTLTEWDNIALTTSAEAAPGADTEADPGWEAESAQTTEEWQAECEETSTETWEGESQQTADEAWHGESQEAVTEAWHAATEEVSGDSHAETVTSEETASLGMEARPDGEAVVGADGEVSVVTYESEYDATAEPEAATATDEQATATEVLAWETHSEATAEIVPVAEVPVEEASSPASTIHPLFTNLNDGLVQLRKIMDENTHERESLREERELLLADTAAKKSEIYDLRTTVATQEEKISSLQSALGALMSQCDQQLQAIRSALGQA